MERILPTSLAGLLIPLHALAAQTSQEPDFLFGAPAVSVGARAGLNLARAEGEIFDFMTGRFTMDRGDFRSAALGLEVAVRIASRLDGVVGLGWAGTSTRSEYRDWVDENDVPIEQTTRLRQVPVTAGAKLYLTPRGRQVGQFAWIPTRLALYAGGGVGFVRYTFEQDGDFVDEDDLSIFGATFESSGWARTAYASGGLELRLSPTTFASFETRRAWASAELSADFVGFDPIDLSGFQLLLGLHRSF